jgi:hypothetical protein
MLALTYGENLYAHVPTRKLAHYVADGMHIAWLYGLALVGALLWMRRGKERLALVGTLAWGATEGGMTAVAGLIGDPRVTPAQWDGWLGHMLRLPLAAVGLTAFVVFVAAVWGPRNE